MSHEAIALWTDTSSDPELIAGVRAGDGTAFGVLYERHVDAAKKVAAQYTNTAADIDDVVSDSFSRVLRALQRGDGPDLAFRAYLFTIVRRTGMEYINRGNRTRPGEDMSTYEDAIGYDAPSDEGVLVGFEQGIVADAFRSLPERWQAVLWYTEVEKKSPKDIAPLLGLTANGVAALAYRAREALRQAYLQQHLNTADSLDCLAASAQLGAYVRGGLAKREHAKVDDHVRSCEKCSALVGELEDVNRGMRGIIAPLILGVLGVGALEGGLPIGGALGAGGAAGASSGASGASGGAAAGGTTGASGLGLAGTGVVAWVSTASAFILPAAAALGIVALVVSGASYLGLFSTKDRNEGQTPAPSDTPEPSASPGATPTAEPTASPSPSVEPSAAPSLEPADAGEGTGATPGGQGVTGGETGGETGGGTGGETGGGTGGDTGGETGGGTGGGTGGETGGGTGGETGGGTGGGGTTPKPASLAFGQAPLDHIQISQSTPGVAITLANSGEGAAEDITASITLPAGLTFAAPTGGAGSLSVTPTARLANFMQFAATSSFAAGDWECTLDETRAVASCVLEDLPAGADAELDLTLTPVTDMTLLAPDARTHFTATAGDVTASYSVATDIERSEQDINVNYVATGKLATSQVGATLMACNTNSEACRKVMSTTLTDAKAEWNNNHQKMAPINTEGGKVSSASTSLNGLFLPVGSTVKYALLEWSASRSTADDGWTGELDSARLRVPGGDYATISADSVVATNVGASEFYQARADITELVAAAGRGDYALADIALSSSNKGKDATYYGGFTITVVYENAALPESTVALFTGNERIGAGDSAAFTFFADNASIVQLGWTAWGGDRGTHGDMVRLDGDNFSPLGWNGSVPFLANSGNAADSTAFGGEWANTLGVDAKAFVGKRATTGVHTIGITSSEDEFLIGSLTVTVTSLK